ncbi:chitin deacetylase 8-like [Nymphalis io]|uniref:chitin deacetylase 8-like n=1 Tax=Inachis io TaxID=171585 RepID=UPI0021687587|nr:chitin deacetylase 8-like [Nymphalis io]
MKFASVAFSLALISFAYARELQLAEPCDEENCKLPMCRCSSVNIPGGIAPRDTPQFVTLTFDDAITSSNVLTYRSLLYNRRNINNCTIGATFFLSHEYSDYTLVNELYNRGFEIALHSISHIADQEYWRDATYERLMKEIGDQKRQVAHFANIPINSIHGLRSPFLQMSGNSTYQMMASAGLTYDLSWPTIKYTNPGLWPYTLHYASIQDCIVPPCPTASLPGSWIIPMISWSDLEGVPCSMVDTCYYNPGPIDEEGWFNLILKNFERHYLTNRAPFGFYVHEWYVRVNPGLRIALTRFLDMINNLNDVFMVNANEVINWVQNPIPVDQYAKRQCRNWTTTQCRQTACNAITGNHTEKIYYMRVCSDCPRVYPWVNNPLGE